MRFWAVIFAAIWTAIGIGFEPVHAQAMPVDEPVTSTTEVISTLSTAPAAAESVEYVDMFIEQNMVSVRSRAHGHSDRVYDLAEIAKSLKSEIEYDGSVLKYKRFQDRVVMSIDMSDGKVRSNTIVLGKLPGFEAKEAADPWLSVNAIAVLTGTHVSADDQGRVVLTLDEQLKPQFGLELWVNGVPLDTFGNEPRTIGPVLLLPLEPVVEELGHLLERSGGSITVRRTEDQALIELELATGLISVNGTPRGVTSDMEFADRDLLLLPFSAVETLTGTHVKLVPGTGRVEVNLDERLFSTSLPGDLVAEEAARTPFTAETLTYEVSDRGPVRAEFDSHWRTYNMRSRLETAGGLEHEGGLEPAWVSTDIRSLDGWAATIGDYSAIHRELSGVGQGRIRGGSWRTQRENGTILAIAAGVPINGSEAISDDIAVPTFGGFAGGARLISEDGSHDYGAAFSVEDDGETGLVVVGGQKRFEFEHREKGLRSAYVSAEVGAFSGDNAGADIRLRGNASYAVNRQVGLNGSASYDGEKFASGAGQSRFAGAFDQRVGARTAASSSLFWRSVEPWGMLEQVSAGVRASVTHQDGDQGTTTQNLTVHANTRIGDVGPSISTTHSETKTTGYEESESTNLRVRAIQRFDWATVTAVYSHGQVDDLESTQQLIATVQSKAVKRTLENGAAVSVAPTATLQWNGEDTVVRAGASAYADSGAALGPRLNLQGRVSALSDFDESEAGTRFFGNLEARYRVTRNMELSAIYSDDFQGRNDLSVALRGVVKFNEPRSHTLPQQNKGILTGRVFLDKNRDGIRQDDEPGVGGVRVKVRGTRLSLNANRDGEFTIQNINQGLYAVGINKSTLPLGYMVAEAAEPSVTIADGRRTEVDIPIILSGQIRGTLFVDDNANGAPDRGEQRLEGQWLKLFLEEGSETRSGMTASFGQYGFENVAPGKYRLLANVSGAPVMKEVEISDASPFQIVQIGVPPALLNGPDLSGPVSVLLGEP